MWKKILYAGLMGLLCSAVSAGERDHAAVGGALGGALGAVIGHDINGRNGAVVGAALGGATGAAIGSDYGRSRHQQVVEVRERERIVYAPPRQHYYEPEPPRYREWHRGHRHDHGWHKGWHKHRHHHHHRHHRHHRHYD